MKYLLILLFFMAVACKPGIKNIYSESKNMNEFDLSKMDTATFGAGCFWCTEAVFQNLKGVYKVVSGYSGGHKENPTYEEVCAGTTGHAEVTQIIFNPEEISFNELLQVFWGTHDPTSLNRQGNDIGTQYRSVIFYHNSGQKISSEYFKEKLIKEKIWDMPIVTEISQFTKFYPAEDYHQNYYNNNPRQGYCSFVITPKVEKFKKLFASKLKDAEK